MNLSLDSALGRQRRLNSVGESVLQIAPSAAAAYSLRSLTGGDPKVVRVRRGSDNHEQDFTASEVSSGALTSFVNAQVVAPLDIRALTATGRDGDFLIAKAAYSLRSLGTRQATLAATGDTVARADGKYVVQVRRSSDDALKSFTATEITDGTLLAFVNEIQTLGTVTNSAGNDGFTLTNTSSTGFTATTDTATGVCGWAYTAKAGDKITVSFDAVVRAGTPQFIPRKATALSGSNLVDVVSDSAISVNSTASYSFEFTYDSDEAGSLTFSEGDDNADFDISNFQVTVFKGAGLVKTWYDQSVDAGGGAHGNHATQATAANQPKIVSAGSLVTVGVDFTDGKLMTFTSISAKTVVGVNQLTNTADFNYLVGKNTGDGGVRTSANNGLFIGADTATSGSSDFNHAGGSTHVNGSQSSFLSTSKNVYFGTATSGFALTSLSTAFSASGTLRAWRGKIAEVIIYDTDQTDNRTAIEANIGEVYSIDLPSGVDPGFDQVDGFVETWYDQSGNSNDAVQATAGSQPKIVSAGSFLNELDFDGTDDNFELTSVLGITSAAAIFTVAESGGGDDKLILDNRDSGVDGFRLLRLSNDLEYRWQSATVDTGTNLGTNTKFLGFANHDGSDAFAAVNGAGLTAVSDTSSMSVAAKPHIGARSFSTASNFWDGTMNELIIYNFDQNDNRLAIETNINNHYSIF